MMTDNNATFPWTRYWFDEQNDSYHSFCQEGYLTLPAEQYRHYYSVIPAQLSELTSVPVLILLGEPGSGKSQSLNDEYHRLKSEDSDSAVVFCDLKTYGDGGQQSLKEVLLDKDKLSLVEQGQKLWILLDGLDECGIHAPAEWLIREFVNKLDTPERVFVRITCRASSWSEKLEKALQERWQSICKLPVQKMRLFPLREQDVHTAAQEMGIDANSYLQAVAEREVEELAALPVTAKFMLALYQQGELPKRRADIFKKGLRLLCEDSPARRDSGKYGNVSPDVRFIAVARLSLGYILQGCNGIWNGSILECPQGLFAAAQIRGKEPRNTLKEDIDGAVINETLKLTGLFTHLGWHRFQFANLTFAEFLAAWYIATSKVPTKQKLTLLLHPESGRLIPDLKETAAWLAALDKEVLEWLIEHEPYAALEADWASLAKADLPALVVGLLNMSAKEERPSYNLERLTKLKHASLDRQLAPVISDKSLSTAARSLACWIAIACELHVLGDTLAELALNAQENFELRKLAAITLNKLENDAAKMRLLPLATSDQNLALKGITLAVLGPKLMGAEAFFDQLSPSNLESSPSSLRYTIDDDKFLANLNADDLLVGLKWIINHTPILHDMFSSIRFKSALLIKAFGHLDRTDLVEQLVKTLRVLRTHYDGFFEGLESRRRQNPLDDIEKRRIVLAELITQIQPEDIANWLYIDEGCVREEDLPWLLAYLDRGLSDCEHRVVVALIERFAQCTSNFEYIDAILNRVSHDHILADQMAELIKPTDLTSEETIKIRNRYLELQALTKQRIERRKVRKLPNPPAFFVHMRLKDCEEGDLKQWSQLMCFLAMRDDGSYGFPSEPEGLPGWQQADDALRRRIAKVALNFLKNTIPPEACILLKNSFTTEERAGGFAVAVLAATNNLPQIGQEVWSHWCLAIVVHHFESKETQELIFREARRAYPEVFDKAILTVLDHQASEGTGYLSLLHSLGCVWHPDLQRIVANRMLEITWPFPSRLRLVEFLIDRGEVQAIDQAKQWLRTETDTENLCSVAQMLLSKVPSQAWQDIQDILTGDAAFAQQVILRTAYPFPRDGAVTTQLDAAQLGWFYDMLCKLFPPEQDPTIPDNGVFTPTQRHDVSHFRDAMIGRLVVFGTSEAVKELDRLCIAHPETPWLIRARADGYQQLWLRERTQITFSNAIELLADESTRIVRTSQELMAAVVEALQRFANEAQHGSPPLVYFLWDERKPKTPLSEQRLSDFLKFYLKREWRDRKIIINREVEIQNPNSFGVGQRVDLLVEATLPEEESCNKSHPRVVIEVKPDSKARPEKDIPEQLVRQYLEGESRNCGIYLVGWFDESRCSLEQLRSNADSAALAASINNIKIASYVLDLSHPRNNS